MELIGKKVMHRMYGAGEIIQQDDKYITVEFSDRASEFQYPNPNTFTKFLQADDPNVQAAILQEIADAKATVEAQQRAKEESKRCAEVESQRREEQSLTEAAERRRSVRLSPASKRTATSQERIPGRQRTFYVFQGSTYDRESRGGYIWAPVTNKAGNTFHHWDRLLDVRPGDIILHGCDGYIQAVSIARGEWYDCYQPEELRTEDMWDLKGRRVDCDYTPINHPVKTATFVDDILRLCNVKYAPFDKDGNGNMGYLYEINRELARVFLRGSAKHDHSLNEVDYVQKLLAEGDNDDWSNDRARR